LSSRGSIRPPEHLVPAAALVAPHRLQAPAGHQTPVPDQAVGLGSNGQSAIISGFQLLAILRNPSPAKSLPHLIPIDAVRGFVLRGLSDAGPLTPDRSLTPDRHPKPFTQAAVVGMLLHAVADGVVALAARQSGSFSVCTTREFAFSAASFAKVVPAPNSPGP
jgi:hypothetical protein